MVRQPGRQPSDDERREAYDAVRATVAGIEAFPPGALETAQLLLEEAKAGLERTTVRSDRFESKATTLLGIVAGGSGVLGVVALSRGATTTFSSPLIFGALALVMLALVSVLYMLRPKGFAEIDVPAYVSTEMAARDHRIPLALILAGEYGEMDDWLRLEIKNEPRALLIAYTATAVAVALIVLNAFFLHAPSVSASRTGSSARPSGQFSSQHGLPNPLKAGKSRS